jgi:hypothetical protein
MLGSNLMGLGRSHGPMVGAGSSKGPMVGAGSKGPGQMQQVGL